MALDLNEVRRVFAEYLAGDPSARWRMDAALAEAGVFAYLAGLAEAEADRGEAVARVIRLRAIRECRDALIPDMNSWRVLNARLEAEYANG